MMKPLRVHVTDNRRNERIIKNHKGKNRVLLNKSVKRNFNEDENYELQSLERPIQQPQKAIKSDIISKKLMDYNLSEISDKNLYDISSPRLTSHEFNLDLSLLPKATESNFDCQPFYKAYDYESRLDDDAILHVVIQNEIDGKSPVFHKELEYQELSRFVKTWDYILYFFLGIDKYGFFQLVKERDLFYDQPVAYHKRPLRYTDENDGQSNESDDELESQAQSDYGTACDEEISHSSSLLSI